MVTFFVLLMTMVSGLAVSPSLAQEEEVITQGRVYYQQYCAACHGQAAKGNGPLVPDLKVKPADLTQMSKKSGGEFPFWRVYRVIEGREEVKGHGTREMPIWGTQFKIEIQEENTETRAFRAAGRILVLVEYLRSIQAQ
jgi:mono/diheme cytochrome c family protein